MTPPQSQNHPLWMNPMLASGQRQMEMDRGHTQTRVHAPVHVTQAEQLGATLSMTDSRGLHGCLSWGLSQTSLHKKKHPQPSTARIS